MHKKGKKLHVGVIMMKEVRFTFCSDIMTAWGMASFN